MVLRLIMSRISLTYTVYLELITFERGIMCKENLLTVWVVLFERSVYFPIWVYLQMVLRGTVKLPASWCSSKVLINTTTSASISPLPRVTCLIRGTGLLRSLTQNRRQVLLTGIQEAQQHPG